ncbi:type I restriction endonuclease subunit R [Acidipropionibacterium acidipropionici]|uniref:type I restriction endonuclease subunit R n=1 Tax=Acidipropionibacterium acidipropionici TaxID=1748 RepID=UPI00110A5234|nr:type I restriction endonuclease subunit R [Acidipropionibacterium acidipropionici]QCV95850.1 type I restriction endonuclease subunit R [Acidipropionibacterium acidipropionici]
MISEADWEADMLDWLAELGWEPGTGSDIDGQRRSAADLVLQTDLLNALRRLNPEVPDQHLAAAAPEITAPKSQDAIAENERLHGFLVHGFRGLTYIDPRGREQTPTLRLLSEDAKENTYRAIHQVTIVSGQHSRRFDVVLYVNGLPLVIAELKKASASATLTDAYNQLQNYLGEFPTAFRTVVATVISDGLEAKYGTPFTPSNHFTPWSLNEAGERIDDDKGLEHLCYGLLEPRRFVDIVKHFVTFEHDDGVTKKIAKPHQYMAVRKAVERTLAAVDSNGKAGVVWHTQGSGKSMEMELYANLVMSDPKLLNPTIVVITDRRDLDGQLYDTFARSTLLPEKPTQIRRRQELRDSLSNRNSGGIYFTTLQKFGLTDEERGRGADHPLLTDRHNVIVIVDEAHRSHYDDLDGYARHLKDALPHGALIAFTGTPISEPERNTRDVFGDYIDIYDLTQAVADGATVPVHFEPRLVKVSLASELTPEEIDEAADKETAGLDDSERERIERTVAVINAIYGAPERLEALARDIVTHWERRRDLMDEYLQPSDPDDDAVPHGKGIIVCSTREIAARLYDEIVKLRPGWHSDDDRTGVIKVVYSGSASDPDPIQKHVRRESQNKAIKNRLKNVNDELELVIVKDMMLTGFDAPAWHTMYLDRPLKGAQLMQALARVNRTFRGKKDGLLVAYAPLADNLKKALGEYTTRDAQNEPVGKNISAAVTETRRLVEALRALLAGCDWRPVLAGGGRRAAKDAVSMAVNYLRSPSTPGNRVEEGQATLKERFRMLSGQLGRMWALSAGSEHLDDLRHEIRFYEEVRGWMAKWDAREREALGQPIPEDVRRMLKGLVAEATAAGEVTDIYAEAGIDLPDLRELTPEKAEELARSDKPQLAIEALRDMLMAEAKAATAHNLTRRTMFSERINDLMIRYTNQQLTSVEAITLLLGMAGDVAAEAARGERFDPPLSADELAFYDAVSQNDSAVELMGDDVLAEIARELVGVMQRDTRTDWRVRADMQAKLRVSIKRLLRKYKYPPDKQPAAVKRVIDQMEELAPRYPTK